MVSFMGKALRQDSASEVATNSMPAISAQGSTGTSPGSGSCERAWMAPKTKVVRMHRKRRILAVPLDELLGIDRGAGDGILVSSTLR